jgi:hypothetical protein
MLSSWASPPQNDTARCNGGEAMVSDSAGDIDVQMPTAACCATKALHGDGGGKVWILQTRRRERERDMDVSAIRLPPARPLSPVNDLGIYITGLGLGWASQVMVMVMGLVMVTRAASLLDSGLRGLPSGVRGEETKDVMQSQVVCWRFPCLQLEMGHGARCGAPPSLPLVYFLFGQQAERRRRYEGKTMESASAGFW